ncbi:MAG: glycosyltransferase family 2 protein, partial [Verrucomicrobiae bacterium]|nr:glycosyltransferase family 2 protein [Verrucomicrobiae bacterium]
EVVRLVRLAVDSGDAGLCVMAARVKMLGREVRRHLHRHLVGRVFATMVHLLTGTGAYDTQCGFKIVPREVFARVSELLEESRFCFDVEMICQLERAGARIIEVPIDWFDRPGSKVRLGRDSIDMALALLRIRKRLMVPRR